MTEVWLPSLITATPQEGFELAVKLSRVAVNMMQPDAAIRKGCATLKPTTCVPSL
jgi:hypothetical protein